MNVYGEYKKTRFDPQKDYYSKKSKDNKFVFQLLSILQIFLSAIIAFLTLFSNCCPIIKFIIAAIGVVATILASVMLLFRPQEHWISYRETLESLKSEEYLFKAEAPPYDTLNTDKERTALFVQRCEEIMGKEHIIWRENAEREKIQI